MPELKSKYALEIVVEPEQVVSGLWRLSYDRLTLVDANWAGRPVVLVPTEDVRLLAVDLPIPNRTQRLAALPYAIEDEVAEPLETLHVCLGQELSPGRYLAAAVRHERMIAWSGLAASAGLSDALLVPDALALPDPTMGHWSVALTMGRIMVRTDAGPAFAIPEAAFEGVWVGGGRPTLSSYGEPLPPEMSDDPLGEGWATWPILASPPPLELRQGRYAAVSGAKPWLRRAAMVLSIGLLAHAALLALDTVALMKSAEASRDVVRSLVTAAGGPPGGDLAATAEGMLRTGSGANTSLTALMGRAALALQPLGAGISLLSVTYATDGGLGLSLEASDLAALQRAEAALSKAGLKPVSGGASVDGGVARETVTLPAGAEA